MVTEQEIEFYQKILGECNVVFDVGCQKDNIFYDLNPDLEIHLFDPNVYGDLLDKIKDKPKIKFNNIAVGSEKEENKDFHYRYGSFIHRTDEKKFVDMHDVKTTDVCTIEDYCLENNINHIDFLKIDTEGFDFEVIKGCGKFLSSITYIQFEEWDLYAKGHTLDDVFTYLKQNFSHYIYKVIDSKPKNYLIKRDR